MSCSSVTLLLNKVSMADTCFVCTPKTLFCKTQHPFLSLSSKRPIKLSFSATSRSWVSFQQPEKSSSLGIIPLVGQASHWAQQGGGGGNGENLSWENQGVVEGSVDGGGGKVDYGEPSEDAKLFVGNLPYDVDSESLAQLFNQAGVVEISEVMFNRETDQSRGFGFVTMSTVEEAQKAVEMFNSYEMNGRLLTVNKAAPRGSQPERSRGYRIYVGNLPWQVDDARLVQIFSEHGKVVSARVVSDQETGRSRGFGFVTMSDELGQNNAIAALDGQSLDGRAIRVSVAEQRSRRGSFL